MANSVCTFLTKIGRTFWPEYSVGVRAVLLKNISQVQRIQMVLSGKCDQCLSCESDDPNGHSWVCPQNRYNESPLQTAKKKHYDCLVLMRRARTKSMLWTMANISNCIGALWFMLHHQVQYSAPVASLEVFQVLLIIVACALNICIIAEPRTLVPKKLKLEVGVHCLI